MANEFEKILNPDNIPGAVSSGYQRQNNLLYGVMTGLDTTTIYVVGNYAVIQAGGLVDVNGFIYKVVSDASMYIADQNATYFVKLIEDENGYITPQLTNDPGVFIPAKYGRYNSNNERILNKQISLGASTLFLSSGTFIVPSGVNQIYVSGCAAGANGGDGDAAGGYSGNGGLAGDSILYRALNVYSGQVINITIGDQNTNTVIGDGDIILVPGGGNVEYGIGEDGETSANVSFPDSVGSPGGKGGFGNVLAILNSTAGGSGYGGLYTTPGGVGGANGGGGGGGGIGGLISNGNSYGGNGGNGGYGSGGGGGGRSIFGDRPAAYGGLGGPSIIGIGY
jgi:hypothetical protein